MQALARRAGGRHHRADLRAAGRRHLSQLGRDHRRRRKPARRLPQDAHPGRPAVQREVLLHAGRRALRLPRREAGRGQRLQGVEDALRDHRRADLLGPVVSGSGAHHSAARRAGALLSDGDRLASGGEGRMGPGAGGRVAHDPARARDRQRRLRRVAQPRRPRGRARHQRHHVLRPLVHRRSVRPLRRRGRRSARRS